MTAAWTATGCKHSNTMRLDKMGTINEEDEEVGRRVISSLNTLRLQIATATSATIGRDKWLTKERREQRMTTTGLGRGGGGNGKDVKRRRKRDDTCCLA